MAKLGTICRPRPPGSLRARSDREVLAFLPAVLEIQETPPSPAGRALLWLILALFMLATLWASVGRVDIVAVAEGRIIPNDRTKVIQPLEMGIIRAIHVRDGDQVRAGDLLVELDPTASEADETRLREDLAYARMERKRLQRALAIVTEEAAVVLSDDSQNPALVTQQRLLRNQIHEYKARLSMLHSDMARQQQALESTRALVAKLEGILPLVTERAIGLKRLTDTKLHPRHAWLQAEQERIQYLQDLLAQRHHLREIRAEIERVGAQRDMVASEFRSSLLEQLADSEKTLRRLTQDLVKAQRRSEWQRLRAPVNGVVQQLDVHTVGGVVTPAQALMAIVPDDRPLEIEAWVLNKDIGFVHADQTAEIKVQTFPFTRYGTLRGKVSHVSRDALEHERLGLAYIARVRLETGRILVDGTWIGLTPGMSVEVEIRTGQRRLIEYLLSPLLRYRNESMRER